MRRPRPRVLALAPLLGAALCALPLRAAEPPRPRGLILISIDTLRADRLGAYGAPASASPAFDSFARTGLLFENAFSAATWTLPSHATMLTGLYPSSHGAGGTNPARTPPVYDLRGFSPDAPSLAEILRARGFRTAAFHFGPVLDARWGFGRGFDVYEAGELKPGAAPGTLVETTFDRAASWLAKQDGRSPYFLFVHTFQVHRYGFIALDEDGRTACPPRFDFTQSFAGLKGADDPLCSVARARYAAAVSCADDAFGRMMRSLDAAGARDAVVIVVGDHGEALCEPHARAPLLGHGFAPYESQIRVPLAVRLPGGLLAGERRSDPAGLVDVAPTALAALGLPVPPGMQGRSLLGAPGSAARPMFAESDFWQMVRADGFKYIRHRDGVEELYDLSHDTSEVRGLASSPEQAGRLDSLRARLRAFAAAQRAGLRLLTRGRRGDRFDVRVESDEPLGYVLPFLTEDSDRVERSRDGKAVTAEFHADADGDEDWLVVDPSVPLVGGLRSPRPPRRGPAVLRVSVKLNGRPVPARRLFVGGRPAERDGTATVDLGTADATASVLSVPDEAAVVVWRLEGATRTAAGPGDDVLRAALKAEGYAP